MKKPRPKARRKDEDDAAEGNGAVRTRQLLTGVTQALVWLSQT